jgi:type IV pilus assembly protein PilO
MNLSEINWDVHAAGTWPVPIKILTISIICSLVAGVWIYYDTLDQFDGLEVAEKQELTLKQTFEMKQQKAVNLDDYRVQLKQIEVSLAEMIRQLPTQAEVANLLVDISQTGLASGLEFTLFKPAGEVKKDFYTELPINIAVNGKYEEFGLFVSGLASLPRIVTVHNVSIFPQKNTEKLLMKATIKTYSEGDGSTPSKKKKRGRK